MPPKAPQTPAAQQQLSQALSSLSFKDDLLLADAHPRPGFGTMGQAFEVDANMFQVKFSGSTTIHHYDLAIDPVIKMQKPKMPKPLTAKIWAQACREGANGSDKQAFAASAFDLQKNVYTNKKFDLGPNGKKEMMITVPESDGREPTDHNRFKITLQYANTVDLDAVMRFCKGNKQSTQESEQILTAIQAVNILLRDFPSQHYTPMGARGRFFGLDGAVDISGGAIVGKGFMQSFRPTSSGFPAIQLDTAHTAFFKGGNLLERIPHLLGMSGGGGRGGRGGRGGFRGGRGGPPGPPGGGHAVVPDELNRNDIRKLSKLLYAASFTLPYKKSSKTFKVKKISDLAANDITFVMQGRDGENDQRISVVQYFKKQFGITIRKPRMPCVVYGKNFMVPWIELVVLNDFNAVPFAQLSGDQAADMIKHAAQRPMDRANSIKQWFAKLDYDHQPKLQQWGVQVRKQMMRVPARVLPTPKVLYKSGKSLNCAFGGWNLRGVNFTRPGNPLKSWAVVNFDNRFPPAELKRFITFFVEQMKVYGIQVPNTQPSLVDGDLRDIKGSLQQGCRQAHLQSKSDPQVLLVLLPRRDTALYQDIKHIAAMGLVRFVTTQCLVTSKLRNDRGLDQYCGNVSMKMQAKLGGVTHEVPVPQALDKTTMMVGADVTHPPGVRAGEMLQPSIAVTVAGKDGDNVRFRPSIRLQEGRVEIITDLEEMMISHIKDFEAATKAPPARIVFFRDGVSEGQYAEVCKKEVEAIRAAAAKYKSGYRPKITFVICAKRHNMRFFPATERDADRTGNLKPGTVVDKDVTHPFAFDFYLQAHAGLQGTARPTHYIVLRDENNFTADKMQMLCNHLCYSYARATRAVSLIPVAYYADIIAEQCRYMAYNLGDAETATEVSGSSDAPLKTRAFIADQIQKRLDGSAGANVSWYM